MGLPFQSTLLFLYTIVRKPHNHMFTENEVAMMIQSEAILEIVEGLKKEFLGKEAPYMEIQNHDFLSLILLVPAIGVAYANANISLKEELNLNKKARKLSMGGYFIKKDPVIAGMQFLIKKFEPWEEQFLQALKKIMFRLFDKEALVNAPSAPDASFVRQVLNAPYIFIRFLSCFFLNNEEDIVRPNKMQAVELDKVKSIGEKLGLSDIPLFLEFCNTFSTK